MLPLKLQVGHVIIYIVSSVVPSQWRIYGFATMGRGKVRLYFKNDILLGTIIHYRCKATKFGSRMYNHPGIILVVDLADVGLRGCCLFRFPLLEFAIFTVFYPEVYSS